MDNTPVRRRYSGTPATKTISKISGNPILVGLAIDLLPNGQVAVVNGNAVTTLSDGSVNTINASLGYQLVDNDSLVDAINSRLGSYKAKIDCGPTFGVQAGSTIHLTPEWAAYFGVDQVYLNHTDVNGNVTQLQGCIHVTLAAMDALGIDLGEFREDAKLQYTDGSEAKFDVFPFEAGLAIGRNVSDPNGAYEIPDTPGLYIRQFPRGNQRLMDQQARRAANDLLAHTAGPIAAAAIRPQVPQVRMTPGRPRTPQGM